MPRRTAHMPQTTINSDDVLECVDPDGVCRLFQKLGYPVELPGAPYLLRHVPGYQDDASAEAWQIAAVEGGKLRVYLLRLDHLDPSVIRQLATRLQRTYPHVRLLLVVTDDWRRLAFVNVRPLVSAGSDIHKTAQFTVKIYRVTVERSSPKHSDLQLLQELRCIGDDAAAVFERHCNAFDVDRVTDRFYKQYREHFERFLEALKPLEPGILSAVRRQSHREDSLHAFTVRLMGRVMFLYFLQKKGWLAGDRAFLEHRYEECSERGALYYNEVLEPLFFEYLARPHPEGTPWGRIPYLNGGLFSRDYAEDLILYLPNELFDPSRERAGLLGFFNSYNFTVDEDTPLDVQVALDPELLGKVFENLMEERERGRSGTFYTPRPIVNFMVRESIVRYLEETTHASITRERLLALLDEERWTEAALSAQEAREIEERALSISVLDPAVGTGAFLVGALQHLVQIVRACRHRVGTDIHPGTPAMADLKRTIIRDCLFGVDINSAAIELAQLRLWLSLVLDLDPAEDPDPLPNLDFQIMAGNSLIDSVDGVRLAPAIRSYTGKQLDLDGSGAHLRRVILFHHEDGGMLEGRSL